MSQGRSVRSIFVKETGTVLDGQWCSERTIAEVMKKGRGWVRNRLIITANGRKFLTGKSIADNVDARTLGVKLEVVSGEYAGQKMTLKEIAEAYDRSQNWASSRRVGNTWDLNRFPVREFRERKEACGVRLKAEKCVTHKNNLNPAALLFGSMKWGECNAHG